MILLCMLCDIKVVNSSWLITRILSFWLFCSIIYGCSCKGIEDFAIATRRTVHLFVFLRGWHPTHAIGWSETLAVKICSPELGMDNIIVPSVYYLSLTLSFSFPLGWSFASSIVTFLTDVIIYTDSTSLSIISSSTSPRIEVGTNKFSFCTFLFQQVSVSPLSHDHCCAESMLYQK